jgi:hypothetical protein
MTPELDEALVRDFPNLYRDRNASMQVTCMCWGFPGDGWEPLIRELSEKLETMILALPEDGRHHVRASQVKEKFGTLRFYMSAETDEMSAAIREAERKSAVTCEICGQPGKSREGGWILTLCDKCQEKRLEEKEESHAQ